MAAMLVAQNMQGKMNFLTLNRWHFVYVSVGYKGKVWIFAKLIILFQEIKFWKTKQSYWFLLYNQTHI